MVVAPCLLRIVSLIFSISFWYLEKEMFQKESNKRYISEIKW